MITTTPKNKSGFSIGVTCPGCGGDLEMESDFFVLTCDHCGSTLRIDMPDIPPVFLVRSRKDRRQIRFQVDRFLKEKSLPLTPSTYDLRAACYPYWKIDAVLLKVRNRMVTQYTGQKDGYDEEITVERKQTEIRLTPYMLTLAAGEFPPYIPSSIGMRADYLHLLPFSVENTEDNFETIPIRKNWPAALDDLDRNVRQLGSIETAGFGLNRTELFHPVGLLVYFPYFIFTAPNRTSARRFVIDGVSGRVLNFENDVEPDENTPPNPGAGTMTEFGRLGVDLHRCRNCGFDLPAEQSYVYICDNCGHLTWLEKQPYRLHDIMIAAPSPTHPADRYLPFWSLKMSENDAARLRPHFGGMFASDRLVIPAARIVNFEALYRLAKRMSTASPKLNLTAATRFDRRFRPVEVPLEEALTLADIIIYRDKLNKTSPGAVHRNDFRPDDIALIYIPFHRQNYFYVDSALGAVTVEKNLV